MLALLLAVFIAGVFVFLTLRPAPIEYSTDVYQAERAILAPGATLTYTPTLTIRQGGYLKFVRTYWNLDTHQVAVDCGGATVPSIITERSLPKLLAGVVRGNIVRLTIPALPPGHYELVSTAIGANGGEAWYSVMFDVVKSCDGG